MSIRDLTQRNVELVAKMEKAAHQGRSVGDRIADWFAGTIGSWTFIICQSAFMLGWLALNRQSSMHAWDPYPFVLLHLLVSVQAAFAAPIIMMSENRAARVADRRNKLELQINMLAEQESTEILRLLRRLCEHTGLDLRDGNLDPSLEDETSPDEVVRQIDSEEEDAAGVSKGP